MEYLKEYNPFRKPHSHSSISVTVVRLLTVLTWIPCVIISVYYSVYRTHDNAAIHDIWDQNSLHSSAFTINSRIACVFWIHLFVWQLIYLVFYIFTRDIHYIYVATNIGSHFAINNLNHCLFITLFIHSYFIWAEVVLGLNFINLSVLYFRSNTLPLFMHAPVLAGPLSWAFFAIYWNGSFIVPNETLAVHILGYIFIWALLGYGLLLGFAYEDYMMCFYLSIISAAVGVAQLERQALPLHWIYPFIITGFLLIFSVVFLILPWIRRRSKMAGFAASDDESIHEKPSVGHCDAGYCIEK